MRRRLGSTLGPVLLALVLTGCGQEADVQQTDGASEPVSTDPATGPTTDPTADPTADSAADYEVVGLPHASDAGGTPSPGLTPIETTAELDTFVSQFERDELAEEIRATAASTSYDGELHATVVSVGCDVPTGVLVATGADGVEVLPQKVADPLDTCLVPVTTVALVALS